MTISILRAARVFSFAILLPALAATAHAAVTITTGTASSNGGPVTNPFYQGTIALSGQNFSATGNANSACLSGSPTAIQNDTVASVTFNPTCAESLTSAAETFQVVSNGTTYNSGTTYYIVVTMNFTGPSITVPNALISDPEGNYSATVANVPFSMTGSATVYSGSASGSVIASIPISGSGIYSADAFGNVLASGPGGIPDRSATYQFQTPSSTMFGLDGTTEGAWAGKYGADGYLIANGPAKYPTYALVNVAGDAPYTWAGQTTDPRALNLPGSSYGIASAYTTQYSNQTFTITINLTDGKTHRVALYALDWDTGGRTETVTITNATSGAVLDSEVLSNFEYGQYATWDLTGNVRITVAPNPGETPVISGIFFDPVAATAPSPSFTLSATAASIAAGASGVSTLTVNPLNSFASSVSLAATAWPAGVTGTFTPNPSATSSSVGINVSSSVTPGTYSLTVTGTSGSLSATTTVALTVTAALAPSFTISATAATIGAEAIGSSTIAVTPLNGFNSLVTLAAPGWPTGITPSIGVNPIPSTATGSVSINVDGGVAAGVYSLPVNATSGLLSASTTIKLTVTTGTPIFTISATPVTIAAGSSGASTVSVATTSGPQQVQLATSGLPAGITATTNAITPPATSAGITISVAAGVTPGLYSLTLIGTETPVSYLTTIALTVTTGGSTATSSAAYTGLDTTTQGTWNGKYGGDGFLIANDLSSTLPSYASTLTVSGATTYTWANLTSDVRALQSGKGFSSRIASAYNSNTFNVNLNLTDGNTHQVAVYMLDWDTTSRAEGIVIVDATTNKVLDQESFSGFHNGQWAVWNIKGNVILKFTTATTNNAVLAGIFFGPAAGTAPVPSFGLSATPASVAAGSSGASSVTVNPLNGFASNVTLAATAWPAGITGTFTPNPTGTSSSVAISAASSVASGVYALTVTGTSGSLSATTTIALTVTASSPSFTLSTTAASVAAGTSGSSTVTAAWTGSPQSIALATSSWPAGITGTTNPITPPATSTSVTINVAAGVTPGLYSLTLIGTSSPLSQVATIALTVTGGSSNSNSSATYSGLDSATQGTWNGKYGGDGFLIANDLSSSLPSYASTLTVSGATTYTWANLTSDVRALQSGKGFSSRIASTYNANTFNVNLNLTDGNTHQVAVYMLDWDSTSRAEGIVIVDATTNAVLDQESFSGFHNGQWAVWNIKGNVILKFTSATTNNAVLGGIFFGPAGAAPTSYPLTAAVNVAISQLNGATEVVQADPSASVVSSADSVTYLVKWGDGLTNSATVNTPFSHTYSTPGTYTVTLTLSDTSGETSSASQSITTQTVRTTGYGEVAFGANTPTAGLVGLTTTLIVPAKPPASGTLFLWPGIQPNPNSPSYNPIGNGVLQPVLTWGPSCAPTAQPGAYSTWWISGQYVNTDSTDPIFASNQCFSGAAIPVNVGDSLLLNMTLSGTVWTQTITDTQTGQLATFSYDLGGQQQGYVYFLIEGYSSSPVTPVQFNNTTFTFSNSTGANCFPLNIGTDDTISAPQLKNNGTACFVQSITLRAPGIN